MGSKDCWIGIKMKDWQFRQEIYHRLNKHHPDEVGPDNVEMMEDQSDQAIVDMVNRYLGGFVPDKIIYPAKSYFVAIVYSRLLRDHFGEDPVESLSCETLLYGNDPHFKSYLIDKHIYDKILETYGWDFDLSLGEIPDVVNYFESEFMIEPYE